MTIKEIIYIPKNESEEFILATFGKYYQDKSNQTISIESTKYTKSLKIGQEKIFY